MVNKTALAVLGVIVLVSMGVGILIGMQLGGPTNNQASDGGGSGTNGGNGNGGDNGDSGSPTPIPGGETEVPTSTAGPSSPSVTESGTPEPGETRTVVGFRRYDSDDIETEMERFINEYRQSRGLDPLSTTGLTAKRVDWMARNHSIAMAAEGKAIHKIDGQSSADRYREADLYGVCQFQKDGGGATISVDNAMFENVETVSAEYYLNDTTIAREIVDQWTSNQYLRTRLTYENANQIGTGVEITDSGDVYATANVC
ncbi:CAP domain-containing protein [Halorientalis salina]|uniref:CAP domain-containing protein n=1 Tax=Halorientalis salina TaxID=2932266 RepID=UPI0010AD83A7|nr:CAP domain-containing protein [Halorientalis salina]